MSPLHPPMAISELSEHSGIPLSTIKFYLREKLLPKPVKTGKTRARYSSKHLDRLRLIKKIQKEGNISLSQIKEILKMIDLGEKQKDTDNTENVLNKKSNIIDSATPLFREKGYDAVTITDIVHAAHVGRATFYKYFSTKKDLFLECIQKIIFIEANNLQGQRVEDEKDILTVFNDHTEALTSINPLWKDMINMLRAAALNDPEEFAHKLDEVMRLKIDLYKRRINKAIKQGVLREIDEDVFAVITLAIQEYCSEYFPLEQNDKAGRRDILEKVLDILLHGILKKQP